MHGTVLDATNGVSKTNMAPALTETVRRRKQRSNQEHTDHDWGVRTRLAMAQKVDSSAGSVGYR